MSKTELTADRLRELLDYNPETGVFTCRVKLTLRLVPGRVMGYPKGKYAVIRLGGHCYKAHRLAWLYMTSSWPTETIDHIDGDGRNNAFCNLRQVTQTLNTQNLKRARSTSQTGVLGVGMNKRRFRARIRTGDKLIHIGSFKTAEAAHAAYLEAKRALHPGNTL